jgi:hypothetical protein
MTHPFKRLFSTIFLLLFFAISSVMAQDDHDGHDHSGHDHESEQESKSEHEHHRHEIGVANSPVYFINEKKVNFGLHMHYLYSLAGTKFGVGVGFEQIFDEHEHRTLGVVFSYRPVDKLTLIASPGVTTEQDERDNYRFALHLESTYEFEIGDLHLGPVFEVAYDPEDIHISLGIHIGVGF